ncbi:uncharacterized protein LOC104887070 [Beta vulgaris subsp. vulgaris]|uniref:uncharacterized protein LOC104887070 n=1 Tax=Beta vulgaris subsp. vulgaris TaxID=3555 RepID=UPI00053F46C4|nr:uncharacterized protein LOC104887070 [Beta vulgaris subsp. vulgaris]
MNVNKQALIAFSIEGTKDELWCDVLPMSACYLLLGRPWQFYRKVIHEGDSNVYYVLVGSKRVRLHPLSPHSVAPKHPPKTPIYFLSSREFEQEVEEEGYAYALIARHAAKSVKTTRNEKLEALMKEFEVVFLEELPQGLPPLRGIDYVFNLSRSNNNVWKSV